MSGPALVFVVYDEDGYECKDLMGLFSTEEKAERYARELREQAKRDFKELMERLGRNDVDRRRIIVEPLEVDVPVREQAAEEDEYED